MEKRITQLIEQFSSCKIDAFLVANEVNTTYLTRFPSHDSWLLVHPKKVYYITDFRYILEARAGLKGITVHQYQKSMPEALFKLASSLRVKRLGLDERHISLAAYRQLKKSCPASVQLQAANHLVENIREVKEKQEISTVRQALAIHQKAFAHIKTKLKPGISEKALLQHLVNFIQRHDVGFSFPPIIASGPNSCYPHAKVSDRKLKNNEPVLIDMGIDLNGYKSDLTRNFFLGKIPHSYSEVSSIVARAQREAIAVIKEGAAVALADSQARNYLQKFNLAKYFGHSLGHGVGLEIHESPRVSQASRSLFKANMIVTVEPAVYIPHKFGIRIEDMVLVTSKGCEVLSDHIN